METALAALIIITLILVGMLTLAQGYLATQEQMAMAWRSMQERAGDRARTGLQTVGARAVEGGNVIQVTVRNSGSTKLSDMSDWDVILQYGTSELPCTRWFPYVETGQGVNQWSVVGIYDDAAQGIPEVLDPRILNPGEELVLQVRVSPPVSEATVNEVAVATPNGVSAAISFAY
ncbi:MAG: hypothetical protein ACUVX9_07515 [Anaerolineae bacterium]